MVYNQIHRFPLYPTHLYRRIDRKNLVLRHSHSYMFLRQFFYFYLFIYLFCFTPCFAYIAGYTERQVLSGSLRATLSVQILGNAGTERYPYTVENYKLFIVPIENRTSSIAFTFSIDFKFIYLFFSFFNNNNISGTTETYNNAMLYS